MRWAELAERRVAVLGFGAEGRAACRAFRRRFAAQTLHLFCSEAEAIDARALGDAWLRIDSTPVSADALRAFDVVIKSPGVSPYRSPLVDAVAAGVRVTSGSALWFAEHPDARTIAVTGTKGKSTTSALIAHLLRAGGHRVALAGNIGLPLLDLPDDAGVAAHVVELSSFQTRDFEANPRVALITNLIEEHLDWHGSGERYVADKLRILGDRSRTIAVLNAEDPTLSGLETSGDVRWFATPAGWHLDAGHVCRGAEPRLALADLPLSGRHNALNLCGALAAIEAAGFDATALANHARSFRPLPHRLQVLGTRDGITHVNDSIATTPQAAQAALDHFAGQRVAVLLGGHERGLDWTTFARAVAARPPHAIATMGANGERIADTLAAHGLGGIVRRCTSIDEAYAAARNALVGGGVLLLSPGAASFGAFRDYAERGRRFAELAGEDPRSITAIAGLGIA
ncbi:MAG TPA: UDP-N-acetylmuramoyl-L-alanine--D-glutamate ligase [Patescibacteria group bacterium]|nr:UDP-N-acetylmuramoyl-L-alanine--D-glutamate ligase [Patescibacteria group bacterium]